MSENQEKRKTTGSVPNVQEKKKTTANVPEEHEKKKTIANVPEEYEKKKTIANVPEEQEKKKAPNLQNDKKKPDEQEKKKLPETQKQRTYSSSHDEAERLKLGPEGDIILNKIRHFIPALSSSFHKGQCGRIGVIGGSREYTGAPYFAAMSSMKIGADLVYVFCAEEASLIIKSYSPELIVIPILSDNDVLKKLDPWLSRLGALVVGPGLGRDQDLLRNVSDIIKYVGKKYYIPLIVDADGLYLVSENPTLFENYKGPKILTPNKNEYDRISTKLKKDTALDLAKALNVVIVQKGAADIITNGMHFEDLELNQKDIVLKCDIPGSPRRCGGQGDILVGCMATFLTWFEMSKSDIEDITTVKLKNPQKKHVWFMNNDLGYSLAAFAACCVTRQCSKFTFQKLGRSMTASDMLGSLSRAYKTFFHE